MKNCLVLVLLDAGILVLLCNGTLSTAQSKRKVFLSVVFLAVR